MLEDSSEHGPYTNYHTNGQIHSAGNYHRGFPIGEWIYYNEDGTEKERKTFEKHNMEYRGGLFPVEMKK